MNRVFATGLLTGILAVGLAIAVHAEEKKCGKSAEAAQACVRKCKVMCNATVEVTNTDSGVVVKVTASNPDDVKKIQECWAKRAACKASRIAASEKAPAACGSTKKGGTCPGMKAE